MEGYFDFYNQMAPNSIKLSYKGLVTFDLIDNILHIISSRLDVIEGNINTRKKVYSILMECLQNLCNYIENQSPNETYDLNNVLLTIENEEDIYTITTGNFIPNDSIPNLKGWLDQINNSSMEELKELYNQILTNNTFTSKGGGGLGFIDIARKSNNKLEYLFHSVDDQYSFFTLNISIKRQK